MRDAGPSVTFDRVAKSYGGMAALDHVSLAIEGGQFVAIVGRSGSGKSTLLKTVNRLIEPDSGTVRIDGAAVTDGDPVALRRATGYVFQNIGLFPHMSVAENIAIGPRLAGGERPDVAALIELVGLVPDVATRLPSALSGGQAQRIGVARAIAGGAKLLLMDEPFGALDPVTRADLGHAVRALHDRLGLTTVMVTHDMAEALLLADRIVVMKGGRIVADATPVGMIRGEAGDDANALVEVPLGQIEQMLGMFR